MNLRWQLAFTYAALAVLVTGILTGLAARTAVDLSLAAERQRSLVAVDAATHLFTDTLTAPSGDPQSAATELGAAAGGRLLWIGSDGHVRIDGAGPTDLVGRTVRLPAQVAGAKAPTVALLTSGGAWTSYAAAPAAGGEVVLVRNLTPLRGELATLQLRLWALGALLAALAVGAGLLAAGSLAQPIEALTAAARRMASGDLRQEVAAGGRGEVATLTRTFNDMAAQVAALDEQRRAFVADAAHELRTPLASLHALAEGLLRDPAPETAAGIARQTDRMGRLVDSLLTLARLDRPEAAVRRDVLRAEDLVREAAWVLEPVARDRRVRVDTAEVDGGARVVGDADLLHRALVNVLDNALRHSPEGGTVTVAATRAGTAVQLTIADEGPGVPADVLPHLGTRFYRADPARTRASGGSGLGLAITDRIVRLHGGSLVFASPPGSGLRVRLDLPADGSAAL